MSAVNAAVFITCINPACAGGNVTHQSGRRSICTACEGAGFHGATFEARRLYYDNRNFAAQLEAESRTTHEQACYYPQVTLLHAAHEAGCEHDIYAEKL